MHVACQRGHGGVVRVLLAARSDANSQSRHGITLLLCACEWEDASLANLLLGAGADPSLARDNGRGPFYSAAAAGLTAHVELLLGANAAVDALI